MVLGSELILHGINVLRNVEKMVYHKNFLRNGRILHNSYKAYQ